MPKELGIIVSMSIAIVSLYISYATAVYVYRVDSHEHVEAGILTMNWVKRINERHWDLIQGNI